MQTRHIEAQRLRAQIEAVLTAWGMEEDIIRITTEVMIDAAQHSEDICLARLPVLVRARP